MVSRARETAEVGLSSMPNGTVVSKANSVVLQRKTGKSDMLTSGRSQLPPTFLEAATVAAMAGVTLLSVTVTTLSKLCQLRYGKWTYCTLAMAEVGSQNWEEGKLWRCRGFDGDRV